MKSYILTLLIFLPLLASLMMLFVPLLKEQKNNSLYRWIALIASGIQLFLVRSPITKSLYASYDSENQEFKPYSYARILTPPAGASVALVPIE